MKVAGKNVGAGAPTFIIAEAGANWKYCEDTRANYKNALRLIDIASASGADAVKFQVYKADKLYLENAGKAAYLEQDKSIYRIIKEREIPYEWLVDLKGYSDSRNIIFLATPFDERSADELEAIGVPAYKIASYTISHIPLLRYIASFGKPVILSTGASELEDIDLAISVVENKCGGQVALMQCTAKYPAPLESINLRAISVMKQRYGVPVGLSDHSRDPFIAPAGAVALGADIIEKHYTVDNAMDGPDHSFAVLPEELSAMVRCIRDMEKARGDFRKDIGPEAKELYDFCRRKIYAARDIGEGKLIGAEDIAVLRSGQGPKGLDPVHYDEVLGRRSRVAIKKNSPITWDVLS
jgi:sialic acid synthase SpsE